MNVISSTRIPVGRHPTAAKHIYIHDAGVTCSSDFPSGKRSVVSCSKALEEVVSHSSLVELNFFLAVTQGSVQYKDNRKKPTIITATLLLDSSNIHTYDEFPPLSPVVDPGGGGGGGRGGLGGLQPPLSDP